MILPIALSVAATVAGLWLAFVRRASGHATGTGRATRCGAHRSRHGSPRPRPRARHHAARRRTHPVGFLLAYLASPVDLVPDFIPLVGFADDVLVLALVLRSVIRRAGLEEIRARWTGTPEGLTVLLRLCRVE